MLPERSESKEEKMKRRRGSMKGIQPAPSNSSDLAETRGDQAVYWESRAERTRNQSRRYKQPAVCDHFAKIAARYDDLARRAREVGTEARTDRLWSMLIQVSRNGSGMLSMTTR